MKTYSLTEVAEFLCGDSMKSPERWITKRIMDGTFTARKVGRNWRMTDQDLAYNLDVIAKPAKAKPVAAVPRIGLSARSARRRQPIAEVAASDVAATEVAS